MEIQINTGHFIKAHDALIEQIKNSVMNSLNRLSDHISRVEVHLSDEDGNKNGKNDKRCVIEARLKGRKPIAVTHNSEILDLAVEGAINKIISMIDSIIGQQRDKLRKADPPSPILSEE